MCPNRPCTCSFITPVHIAVVGLDTSMERWHRVAGWKSGEFFCHGIATDHLWAIFPNFKSLHFWHQKANSTCSGIWPLVHSAVEDNKEFVSVPSSPGALEDNKKINILVKVSGWDLWEDTWVPGFVTDLLCDISSAKHQAADPEEHNTDLTSVLLT